MEALFIVFMKILKLVKWKHFSLSAWISPIELNMTGRLPSPGNMKPKLKPKKGNNFPCCSFAKIPVINLLFIINMFTLFTITHREDELAWFDTHTSVSGSQITQNFGFISCVTDISVGSLPVIFSSMTSSVISYHYNCLIWIVGMVGKRGVQ